jgi:type IV pilus assembly protein PilW
MTELLIAMAITAIVMGAVYSTYKSQQDSYVVQEQVAEAQQNLRAALYLMSRDIRMAGYDPTGNAKEAGFLGDLLAPYSNDSMFNTDSSNIAFALDDDGDDEIDASATPDNDAEEQCAYRLNSGKLEKYIPTSGWVTVAENIDALNFVYLDGSNNVLTTTNQTERDKIRSVQIALVARTRHPDNKYYNKNNYYNLQGPPDPNNLIFPIQNAPTGDHYRRRIFTTTVQCRNMGL